MINKNILIIGGSGLVGASISNFLIKNKFNVYIIDRKKNKKFEKNNFLKININEKSDYKKIVKYSLKKFKNIDIVINCIYPAKQKSKYYYKDIIKHLEPFIKLTKEFGEYFSKKNKGQIINFASIYGKILPRFEIYRSSRIKMPIDYAISKNLIIQLSKFYAKLYLKNKVKINTISLGGIFDNQDKKFIKKYSKFVGSNNLLSSNDINDFILYLLKSNSMKFTGQDFCFDDGFTL
tara:strand:- start:2714 stop:3418 length:705 start_codon:yes stop_codon:yes gene_type:complete